MSLEEQLAANTAAIEVNTAALEANTAALIAEGGTTADAGSAGSKGGRPPPKETAAAKKKREAAERKAAEELAASEAAEQEEEEQEEEADLVPPRKSISSKALGKLLGDFMEVEDEDEAAEREEAVTAAFDHLGHSSLGDFADEAEDRVKVAMYADNWIAGNTVNFASIDEDHFPEDETPKKADKKSDKKKKSLLG